MTSPCYQGLSEFRKVTPPSFYRDYNLVLAEKWVMQLEKIFTVMRCMDFRKVVFATYMLEGEAEHWWKGAKTLLESNGTEITWKVFLTTFFNKYFPNNVKNEK